MGGWKIQFPQTASFNWRPIGTCLFGALGSSCLALEPVCIFSGGGQVGPKKCSFDASNARTHQKSAEDTFSTIKMRKAPQPKRSDRFTFDAQTARRATATAIQQTRSAEVTFDVQMCTAPQPKYSNLPKVRRGLTTDSEPDAGVRFKQGFSFWVGQAGSRCGGCGTR